jgi:hypothetical protein
MPKHNNHEQNNVIKRIWTTWKNKEKKTLTSEQ